jgi:hypothetical protein
LTTDKRRPKFKKKGAAENFLAHILYIVFSWQEYYGINSTGRFKQDADMSGRGQFLTEFSGGRGRYILVQ